MIRKAKIVSFDEILNIADIELSNTNEKTERST